MPFFNTRFIQQMEPPLISNDDSKEQERLSEAQDPSLLAPKTAAVLSLPSSSSSSLQVDYDYEGSVLPCPDCVRRRRFVAGGIGDFQKIPLKLKVEVSILQRL